MAEEPETAEPETAATMTIQPVLEESVPEVCPQALVEADKLIELATDQNPLLRKQNTIIPDLSVKIADAMDAPIGDLAASFFQMLLILDRNDNVLRQARSVPSLNTDRYDNFANECRFAR